MKKYLTLILILASFILVSCTPKTPSDIVTTTYFQYDIVKNIVEDNLNIEILTKPGIDNHDYLPSSKQMTSIRNSKLFIFTSYEMDNWLNRNVNQIVSSDTTVLNLSEYNDININDQHYWTDPVLIMHFINIIKDEIIKIDPINTTLYEENATNYYNKINTLHNEFINYLSSKNNITLYFAGHNAMRYFENRYGFTIIALSNTSKPDADLTSQQIIDLLEIIKTNNVSYLFTEELKEPRVAQTIKNELAKENYNLELLELHGYHNVSQNDASNNVTYYDLFLNNIKNIKKAFGD